MKQNSKKKKSQKIESKEYFEIKGIIFLAIGLLSFVGIYTNLAGFFSTILQVVSSFLVGMGTFVIPFYIVYLSFKYLQGRGYLKVGKKFKGITLLVVVLIMICGTIYIQSCTNTSDFLGNLSALVKSAANNEEFAIHGGVLAYFITFILYKFIGGIGSYIVYSTLIIISGMLIFDISILEVLNLAKAKKSASKDNKKRRKTAIENNNNKIKNKDHFINVVSKDDEDETLINNVNDKIKILDFMKNSVVDDDVDELAQDKYIDDNINKAANEAQRAIKNNKKENIDSNLKDDVNNEINSNINDKKTIEKEYEFPDTNLLVQNSKTKLNSADKKELVESANKLEEILGNFGVEANVVQVTKGPSVTRYELQPSPGVKVSKIVNLADDIALGLAASGVRIEAPIPGKAAIGIEVPNKVQTAVFLREVLDSNEFKNTKKKLAFALGKDIGGACVVGDLSKMPHTLIAGATGSGKSVCINSLIISILYKYSPKDVKLLLVDPKVVELNVYNGIPHLLIPVVTDPKKAAAALNWAVNEMTKRYNLFAEKGVRNIDSYNKLYEKGEVAEKMPYIIIIVDELADLMMVCANEVEDYIGRLAQMARAAGMHLVIATQRPSVDVITGVIKANIPSRISFAVSSQVDSRTILDSAGAEKLLGKGDMLYYPVGEAKPQRVQGCFISEEEVEKVVEYIKSEEEQTSYEESIIEHINSEAEGKAKSEDNDDVDELLNDAINIVVEFQQASTSFIQRKLRIGFNRASRIMDQLEERGIISPRDGSKPRNVLVTKAELMDNNNNDKN